MAMKKYEKWLKEESLIKLKGWAEDGLSQRKIAGRMGISAATLRDWKNRYPEIEKALNSEPGQGIKESPSCGEDSCPFPDRNERLVEEALLRRALGYSYTETTYEPVLDDDGRERMIVKRQVEKQVVPDLSAQTFWLKNRNPEKWKDKQEKQPESRDITVKLVDENED